MANVGPFLCQVCRHPLQIYISDDEKDASDIEFIKKGETSFLLVQNQSPPPLASPSTSPSPSFSPSQPPLPSSFVSTEEQNDATHPPPFPLTPSRFSKYKSPNQKESNESSSSQRESNSKDFVHASQPNASKMIESFVVVSPSNNTNTTNIIHNNLNNITNINISNYSDNNLKATNLPFESNQARSSSESEPESLDQKMKALSTVLQLASQQTKIDQPLCNECMLTLHKEIECEIVEAERDIHAYNACLKKMEMNKQLVLTDDEFDREKNMLEEEEKHLLEQLKRVNEERKVVNTHLSELESKLDELDELENMYWQNWNDFKLQLLDHQETRDAVVSKMESSSCQLEHLKATNVLSDCFRISNDGDFGTINSFRLGRLPNIHVEWDEINAAWGQTCLLLHTISQTCQFTFTNKIFPMGSYPRISDGKITYDLFGPVNLFWSTKYDRAMSLFLSCLKEFSLFAYAKDKGVGKPHDKCFKLAYPIEGDKVNGLTIHQSFNRDERWTKALKWMLCDLKLALVWLTTCTLA